MIDVSIIAELRLYREGLAEALRREEQPHKELRGPAPAAHRRVAAGAAAALKAPLISADPAARSRPSCRRGRPAPLAGPRTAG